MKKIVKTIAFCIVLTLFLSHIYKVFSWKDTAGDYYSSMDSLYNMEEDLVDVLFLGSSRCYCSINNSVLWQEQGISSFSLAISGQDLVSSYHCFVEALKTQSPEVVGLELYGTTFHGYAVDSNMYRNTLPFRLSSNAVSAVQNIAEDRQAELLLKWPIVHTRYTELKEGDFVKETIPYLGYHAEFNIQPVEPLCTYFGEEVMSIGEEEEMWLRKIIELAEEKDIQLCLFVAPIVSSQEDQMMFNYVKEIAEEYSVPLINMPKMQEELQLNLGTDFINWSHTNYYGAYKVSSYMGKFLKENYDLEDRRGDERYAIWDADAKIRGHEYDNQLLVQTYDVTQYMELLANKEDYTIVVAANGNYYADGTMMEGALATIGIDSFYDAGGIWVINNGQIVMQSDGEDFFDYMELSNGDLAVSSEFGISNIIVDKQSYSKVQNGVNVVVYDNTLGIMVDAVGFDASAQYAAIK